jgi:N-terminal domain of BNR-repeat neuraminidase/Secretion system C-terminal sorting domain
MFKASFLFVLIFMFSCHQLKAQVSTYAFSQGNSLYTPITGGLVHESGSAIDNNDYNNIPIGFTFNYNCQNFTSISINANGFIAFGSSVELAFLPISFGASNNVVAALGRDLLGLATGELRSQTIGTAPNRTFVVQWSNIRSFSTTGGNYNFQIRLNETTNTVQIHYGAFSQTGATNRLAEVGLRGSSTADFSNRRISGASNWTTTTTGTLNSHTCLFRNGLTPDNGRMFTFTPTATLMTYTSSTCTQLLTGNVKRCPLTYQIARLEVVMSTGCPVNLTQLVVGSASSSAITSDVTSMRVYYTGNSSTFSTANLMNPGGTVPSGSSTAINGNIALSVGSNYFWITYDVNNTAALGNLIDASCNSITVNGMVEVPTISDPPGSATIVECPSPGGVTDGIQTWLKADMGYAAGVPATWDNQVPGTPTVMNGTANPARNTTSTSYNYNPYIEFSGPNSVLTPGGVGANREFIRLSGYDMNDGIVYKSLFFALQLDGINRPYTHLATLADVTTWSPPAAEGTLHGHDIGGFAAIHDSNFDTPDFGSGSASQTWQRNATAINHDALHTNTKQILSAISTTADGIRLNRFLGGQNDDVGFYTYERDWIGPVGEIIGFTSQLSAIDRTKVHSYLALKYGLTLSEDYIATSGTTIYSTAAPYNTNVIGIGRDDNEELNQKQSHQNDDDVRIYLNTLAATNQANAGSFTTNISYVVQGSNLGVLCATSASNAEIPTGLMNCAIYSRLEREWKVTRTNIDQTYNMDIRLDACAVLGSIDVTDLRLLVDDDGDFSNGGTQCYFNGDGTGIVISYTNPYITISGISITHIPNNQTRFITVASVNSATPLPVELTYFEADLNQNRVVDLYWNTASELNNDFFTIEKSFNGTDWTFFKNTDAAGTSTETNSYSLKDENPTTGINYYRLSQTDVDGGVSFHGIRSVYLDQIPSVQVYPNPTQHSIFVSFRSKGDNKVYLFDISGRLIYSSNILQNTVIQIEDLAKGLYILKTSTGEEVKVVVE